ncbi:hypothetical protein ACSSS7_003871 [Eimeria intestinalis]
MQLLQELVGIVSISSKSAFAYLAWSCKCPQRALHSEALGAKIAGGDETTQENSDAYARNLLCANMELKLMGLLSTETAAQHFVNSKNDSLAAFYGRSYICAGKACPITQSIFEEKQKQPQQGQVLRGEVARKEEQQQHQWQLSQAAHHSPLLQQQRRSSSSRCSSSRCSISRRLSNGHHSLYHCTLVELPTKEFCSEETMWRKVWAFDLVVQALKNPPAKTQAVELA